MTNKKLIVIFSLIFVGFCLGAIVLSNLQPEKNIAIITVNGEMKCEVDLEFDDRFVVKSPKGSNTIVVKDNEIYVEEATCPDYLCIKHGKLRNKYDSIVCLPNKVVIEYKTASDVDAVAGR